jgi:hypothetical protein
MPLYKIKRGIIYILLFALLTACGHPIPPASNDLLSHKKSILVLTSPSINLTLQSNLAQTLSTWKQSELITYEWIQHVNVIDDMLIQKINRTAYDYIIGLGSELTPTLLTAAPQTQDKKWIALTDTTQTAVNPSSIPGNVALYQIDAIQIAKIKDERTKSVAEATYQALNSLIIPTMDIQKKATIIWDLQAVLAEQLQVIHSNSFEKGNHYYNSQQMTLIYQ